MAVENTVARARNTAAATRNAPSERRNAAGATDTVRAGRIRNVAPLLASTVSRIPPPSVATTCVHIANLSPVCRDASFAGREVIASRFHRRLDVDEHSPSHTVLAVVHLFPATVGMPTKKAPASRPALSRQLSQTYWTICVGTFLMLPVPGLPSCPFPLYPQQ